jgi:hypothetical protein
MVLSCVVKGFDVVWCGVGLVWIRPLAFMSCIWAGQTPFVLFFLSLFFFFPRTSLYFLNYQTDTVSPYLALRMTSRHLNYWMGSATSTQLTTLKTRVKNTNSNSVLSTHLVNQHVLCVYHLSLSIAFSLSHLILHSFFKINC